MGSGFDARLKKMEAQIRKAEEERLRAEAGVMLGVSCLGRPMIEARCEWALRFARKHQENADLQLFAALYFWTHIKPDPELEHLLKAQNRFVVEAVSKFSLLRPTENEVKELRRKKNIG